MWEYRYIIGIVLLLLILLVSNIIMVKLSKKSKSSSINKTNIDTLKKYRYTYKNIKDDQ